MSEGHPEKSLCPICASDTFAFVVEDGGEPVREPNGDIVDVSKGTPRAAFECTEGCKISVEGAEPVRRLRHLVMWSAA